MISRFQHILMTALLLFPSLAAACPRCVEATPFKFGLQLAVLILLPLPFALGFTLYRWVRGSLSTETEDAPSQETFPTP